MCMYIKCKKLHVHLKNNSKLIILNRLLKKRLTKERYTADIKEMMGLCENCNYKCI